MGRPSNEGWKNAFSEDDDDEGDGDEGDDND